MKYIFKHIFFMCIILSCVLPSGCRQKERHGKFSPEEMDNIPVVEKTTLPPASGGVTLSVMNETLTVEGVLSQPGAAEVLKPMTQSGNYDVFKIQARPVIARVVMGKVSDILIYHLAQKNSSAAMEDYLGKAVEKEVNRFVANYGNDYAQAEKAFKELGLADWSDFREYKKKLLITQAYVAREIKKSDDDPITHSEMVQRYNELKDEYFQWEGKIQFRLIDIIPNRLEPDEINTEDGETPGQAAMRKARDLKSRLEGGTDFGKLAEANSHGIGRNNGGLWETMTEGTLVRPYDKLEEAAKNMEPGDISDIIEVPGHVFIMKLEDKTESGSTPFKEVQDRIEEEIKLLRQRKEYNKVIADIVEQANIADMDLFTEYCLQTAFRKFRE